MSNRYNLRSKTKTSDKVIIPESETEVKHEPSITEAAIANISLDESKFFSCESGPEETDKHLENPSKNKTPSQKKSTKKVDKKVDEPFSKKKGFLSKKLYDDLCAIGADKNVEYDKVDHNKCWIGKYTSGNCFLSALSKGYLKIEPKNGKAELERVIFEGKCPYCKNKVTATVQQLLDQSDYGGDYEDGSEGAEMLCTNCCPDCDGKDENCAHDWCNRYYVTGLCINQPEIDTGKFHSHCQVCPGFGQCTGDYRNAHCGNCDQHYFSGLQGFACPCSPGGDSEDDDYFYW